MKKLGILKNLCPTLFNFRTDFFEFELSFFTGLCWFGWLTFFGNHKSLHNPVFNPVQRNLPVNFLKAFIINIKNNTIFGIYNCSKFCPESCAFFFCNSIYGRQGKLKADLSIDLVYVLPSLASTTGKGYLRIVEDGGVESGFVHMKIILFLHRSIITDLLFLLFYRAKVIQYYYIPKKQTILSQKRILLWDLVLTQKPLIQRRQIRCFTSCLNRKTY